MPSGGLGGGGGAAHQVGVVHPTMHDQQQQSIGAAGKRKEIYRYEAAHTLYAASWSQRPDKKFRLAIGSFIEEYNNKVDYLIL